METELTNAQILGILNTMSDEEGQGIMKLPLPVKLLYALNKSSGAVNEAYKTYETTAKGICERHGTTIEKPLEGGEECMKEVQELLDMKVKVDIHKVPESVLEECSAEMTMGQYARLQWVIDTPEPEKKEKKEKKADGPASEGNGDKVSGPVEPMYVDGKEPARRKKSKAS